MSKVTVSSAVSSIKKAGALLVFPIKEKPALASIWSTFYPNTKMDWDWSEDGDGRVASLWHLRTQLSTSRKVVYSKWLKNRATVFSLELFTALLSLVSSKSSSELWLSNDAQNILSVLEDDSPLATKELKLRSELRGRENNSRFERATKELWQRFLIVGFGEADEGGYPSLLVGSSKLLFEDAWDASKALSESDRDQVINKYFLRESDFYKQYLRVERSLKGMLIR